MSRPVLSIVVPVYNEERTLAVIMKAITEACPEAEVLYVNDGSADKSLELLHTNARPQDQVLTKPNGGKGSAVRLGLEKASGTYCVIQDADLEYDPGEIALLVQEAEKHPGSAVFGSRFLKPNPNIYKRYLLGNKTLTTILNILFFARLTDSYTCYKLLPTEAFRGLGLTADGFELEAEIAAKCLRRGIPVREVPISYKPRTIEEGKKINWRDAVKGVLMMVRMRLGLK